MIIKPITIDLRKDGYEDLYNYVLEYAKKNNRGKISSAVIDIIRDHEQKQMEKNIIVLQGDRVLAKA
jgi:metal-responsive CopG/Arc/MetJ family transcriptional regulator